jgi:hypothetical protein
MHVLVRHVMKRYMDPQNIALNIAQLLGMCTQQTLIPICPLNEIYIQDSIMFVYRLNHAYHSATSCAEPSR